MVMPGLIGGHGLAPAPAVSGAADYCGNEQLVSKRGMDFNEFRQ